MGCNSCGSEIPKCSKKNNFDDLDNLTDLDSHAPKSEYATKQKNFPLKYLNKITQEKLDELGDFDYEFYKVK